MRAIALVWLCGCATTDLDRSLEQSARWLLARQGEDGGWHSEAYSALRDGTALTPVVLSTLLFAAKVDGLEDRYRRGSDFVARLPEQLDYPVYSMSGALLVLSVPVNARHEAVKSAIIDRLFARQLAEPTGWTEEDAAYGGWGYFHGVPQKTAEPDQLLTSNITSTLFAVGGLTLAGVPLDDERLKKALVFVQRCQNSDGGFFFTPSDEIANKAGRSESGFRSYGTATADGVRALMRLGTSRSDPRVVGAARWLAERFDPERVPGDYPPDREVQRDSAYYYWAWTSAHALMLLGPAAPEDWAPRLAKALIARQQPDGSWRNDAVDMREDDPLVATPLAASALAICRSMLRDTMATAIEM